MTLKKTFAIFVLFLFVFSCQTSKRIIFDNSDFQRRINMGRGGLILGEEPLKIIFEEAFIKTNIFYAKGYIFVDFSEPLDEVLISIKKGEKEQILGETKEDGSFEIKIKKFSQYDTLKFYRFTYIPVDFVVSTLLER